MADDGCNVADKSILASENFLTVAALGFSVFELGFVEGLNILVAKFGPSSALCSECGNGEVDAGSGSDPVIWISFSSLARPGSGDGGERGFPRAGKTSYE
jgi:hypothetical protein